MPNELLLTEDTKTPCLDDETSEAVEGRGFNQKNDRLERETNEAGLTKKTKTASLDETSEAVERTRLGPEERLA